MAMRLRVRAVSGGATLRVQVPNPGTIHDLRNIVSLMIGIPADTIRFSLNKRETIDADAEIPLSAYGICSGDLLYYISEEIPVLGSGPPPPPRADTAPSLASGSSPSGSSDVSRKRELCAMAADRRAKEAALGTNQAASSSSSHVMNVEVGGDGDESGDGEDYTVGTLSQIPSLFSRIMAMEKEHANRLQDFLVMAVHAVMLETGFVVVGCTDNRIDWGSLGSLKYTLPELANQDVHVVLKCQVVGSFVVVYGSVKGCQQFHRLSLPVTTFLNEAGVGEVYKDAFALWKELKDNLTLRLLSLVNEVAGLPLPACFQLLPTELKLMILESLSPTDLGSVACVCSELRFLAASEHLWRIMYLKEFKLAAGQATPSSWRQAFIRELHSRRRTQRSRLLSYGQFFYRMGRRAPLPHHPWGVIGGDYDIYPNLPFPPRGGIGGIGGFPRFRRPITGSICPLGDDLFGRDGPDEPSLPGVLRLPRPGEEM